METSQSPTKYPKIKGAYRVASTCSCPQCDSVVCFKKRYENSNLLCSCPNCKESFGKNNSSKRCDERNYKEITSKVKEDEQNQLIHTNTIIRMPNKLSVDECYCNVTKEAVKENEHQDLLDNEVTNKKSNEKIYLELTRKDKTKPEMQNVKSDDEIHTISQMVSTHSNTIIRMPNKISYDECYCNVSKEAVKENEHQDQLDNEVTNKKSNEKIYLELTREDKTNTISQIISTIKEYQQKKELNTQGQKSDDQSKQVVSEKVKQNDLANANHYFVNKKFKNESYHETFRKNIKEDGKKGPLVINIKCDHSNKTIEGDMMVKKESIKTRYEKKDTLSTQLNSKCYFGNKKSEDKGYLENEKSVKNDENKDTQNIESKSDYSNKKSNDERSEKTQICGCGHEYNNKPDEINFSEIARKVFKEHKQNDTLNKHNKSENSEVKLCEHTEFSYKDATIIKDNIQKKERSYEESYTRDYSVAMTYTRKKEKTASENPTSTLSAQIMNLPYQDFKDSFSSHKPANSLYVNKISKQDFLAKLKEIYKACSCKVCECIPGFCASDLPKNDTSCCEETKYKHTQIDSDNTNDCAEPPHSGCACYRCDRKDCKGVWKNKTETPNCDCEPCDCVKFTRSFTKPCDCEPCQCAECASSNFHIARTVIVAPVQGNFQHNLCQCEPCECEHCSHNYSAMASNLMREVSTGMALHRNCNCETCANNSCQFDGADCRCDTQNRIVRKPIDRSVRDYDIHRALIGENRFSQNQSEKLKKCDTIAMFAFCSNNSNTIFNKSGDGCNCMDCECIICKEKDLFLNKIKNSYEDIPDVFLNLSDKSFSACKCQPCECQMCCKNEEAESDVMQVTRDSNNCGCDICYCIFCKGLPYCSQNKEINYDNKSGFKTKSLDFSIENSNDFSNKMSTAFVYPLKKGKVLTPSMFEAKILSQNKSRLQSSLPNLKKPLPSKSILKINSKKSNKNLPCSQNITICHSKLVNKNCDNNINNPLSNRNLLPTNLNYFDIETNPNHFVTTTENNMAIYCDTIAQKFIDSIESPSTNFIYPKKSSAICVDNTKNEIINHSIFEGKNDEVKVLNKSPISNDHRTSKREMNSDADLFCSRIISFEKSIFQIQQDISQYRTVLAEISSINGFSHQNFSENNGDINVYHEVSEKSLLIMHKAKNTDSAKFTNFNTEPDKINNSVNEKVCDIDNKTILIDGLKYDKNDSFSKGDNKMYVRLIKRSHININKLKKNVARSRIKKVTRNSENKVIDYISDQLKDNYRHHGSSRLVRKIISKSASTSYENNSMPQCQSLKLNIDDIRHPQTVICEGDSEPFSVLRKNLHMNKTPVSHKEICTFPDLERNVMRAVQSTSLQTNETGGYAALTKLQAEVSKLLDSPLLQLKRHGKSDMNVTDHNNVNYKPQRSSELLKTKCCDVTSQTRQPTLLVEKETNCNIGQSMDDMKIDVNKLLEFLLTRTVCKSELTKPFSTITERLEVPKINSVKRSYEGLKARLLTVRRVSDHSVLVRWMMPREVEDVQGYELQVDGRPVQKILSPTRCMAVLTSLPHCDKVLLTVRTLTHSAQPPALRPTATMVYCPREKRTRHPRQTIAEQMQ